MNDVELLKLALDSLEDLVNLAEYAMKHCDGEYDVEAELKNPRHVIFLLCSRLAPAGRNPPPFNCGKNGE